MHVQCLHGRTLERTGARPVPTGRHYPAGITTGTETALQPGDEPGDPGPASGLSARARTTFERVRAHDWRRYGRPLAIGRFRMHPAAALTAVGIIVWVGIFGTLAVQHHRNFGTWSFDMGIYDQGYWLVSRFGQTFVTVRGLEFWGQHINLIAYAYAPFYWLGAGPTFLMATQAGVLGLGAAPVYLIARDRLGPWYGFAFALSWLFYPAVQFISWANYHPEALIPTAFLYLWWFQDRGKWRPYWITLALVLSIREDVALAIIVLGVVMWVRRWRAAGRGEEVPPGGGWAPIVTFLAGALWYLFATKLAIPHFNNGEEPFYVAYFYSAWGTTMGEVIGSILRHPNRVVSDATQPDRLRFYRDLLLPLGMLPLGGVGILLMAAPQMLASVIGASPYARMITYQYTTVMIAPIFIASIEGYRRWIHPRPWRHWAIAWMLGCAVVTNIAWSPSPIGERYGLWAMPNGRVELLGRAIALVPDDAPVTATFSVLPHLTHREQAYDWPNPWKVAYWGNANENPPDPAVVEYFALDLRHVAVEDQQIVRDLVAPGGEFETLLEESDVIVARRIRPPASP